MRGQRVAGAVAQWVGTQQVGKQAQAHACALDTRTGQHVDQHLCVAAHDHADGRDRAIDGCKISGGQRCIQGLAERDLKADGRGRDLGERGVGDGRDRGRHSVYCDGRQAAQGAAGVAGQVGPGAKRPADAGTAQVGGRAKNSGVGQIVHTRPGAERSGRHRHAGQGFGLLAEAELHLAGLAQGEQSIAWRHAQGDGGGGGVDQRLR